MSSRCSFCSKTGAGSICSGCKITFYCNSQCQRKHWKTHKKECKSLAKEQHKLSQSTKQLENTRSPSPPSNKLKLTKSRNSVELKDINEQQLQLKQLADETALFEQFRQINKLNKFTDKLESNPDSIAFYLDHPQKVKQIIKHPDRYQYSSMNDNDKHIYNDPDNYETYIKSLNINRNWFKQHSSIDIVQEMRQHFDVKNANNVTFSEMINDIIKMIYKVELTTEILNEIEYFVLDDYKINIIEIDAEIFSNDLYKKQIKDTHWIENNILNKRTHDINDSFFSKYLKEKQYKNHNNVTNLSQDDIENESDLMETLFENYNTKLTNDCILCGDIIYVNLDCIDFKDHAIRQLFYIINSDNKTMELIGIIGHNGIHCGNYIYGKHVIIPYFITYKFYDPIKIYLTFMHILSSWDGAVKNVQIELQISNKCVVFNKNIKHNNLTKLQENKLLSYYQWPNENMNEKKTHKYKYNVNEMSLDNNYCTIYIDLNTDDGIFGYCNNEQINCINLSMLKESSIDGYIVKYKGDTIRKPLSEVEVNELLLRLNNKIEIERVSKCLKKGIANHLISIDKSKGINTIILKERCDYCNKEVVCRVKDALYQSDIGANIYGIDYENSAVDECDCGIYVIGMCTGNIQLDNGKYFHHCKRCPNMGTCIGDHKQGHCTTCNKHYYWGKSGELACDTCKHSNQYVD